jgi:carotenoid cleavage dioxygenase
MPSFLPVPWYRWQRFRIEGVVRERESGRPLPGFTVRAFDRDVLRDDHLGDAPTDADGRFEIRFSDTLFKDAIESRPDIYLCVFAPGADQPVQDTSCAVRENAGTLERFEIEVPRALLPGA